MNFDMVYFWNFDYLLPFFIFMKLFKNKKINKKKIKKKK